MGSTKLNNINRLSSYNAADPPPAVSLHTAPEQASVNSSKKSLVIGDIIEGSKSSKLIAELRQRQVINEQGFLIQTIGSNEAIANVPPEELTELSETLKTSYQLKISIPRHALEKHAGNSMYAHWIELGLISPDPTEIVFSIDLSELLLIIDAYFSRVDPSRKSFDLNGTYSERLLKPWSKRAFEAWFDITTAQCAIPLKPWTGDYDFHFIINNASLETLEFAVDRIQRNLAHRLMHSRLQSRGNSRPTEIDFDACLLFIKLFKNYVAPSNSEYRRSQDNTDVIYSKILVGPFEFIFLNKRSENGLFLSNAITLPLEEIIQDIKAQRLNADGFLQKPFEKINCTIRPRAPSLEAMQQAVLDQNTLLLHAGNPQTQDSRVFVRAMARITKEGVISAIPGQMDVFLKAFLSISPHSPLTVYPESASNIIDSLLKYIAKHPNDSSDINARMCLNILDTFCKAGASNETLIQIAAAVFSQIQNNLSTSSIEYLFFQAFLEDGLPYKVAASGLKLAGFYRKLYQREDSQLERVVLLTHDGETALQIGEDSFITLAADPENSWKTLTEYLDINPQTNSELVRKYLQSLTRKLLTEGTKILAPESLRMPFSDYAQEMRSAILKYNQYAHVILPCLGMEMLSPQTNWCQPENQESIQEIIVDVLIRILSNDADPQKHLNLIEEYVKPWLEIILSSEDRKLVVYLKDLCRVLQLSLSLPLREQFANHIREQLGDRHIYRQVEAIEKLGVSDSFLFKMIINLICLNPKEHLNLLILKLRAVLKRFKASDSEGKCSEKELLKALKKVKGAFAKDDPLAIDLFLLISKHRLTESSQSTANIWEFLIDNVSENEGFDKALITWNRILKEEGDLAVKRNLLKKCSQKWPEGTVIKSLVHMNKGSTCAAFDLLRKVTGKNPSDDSTAKIWVDSINYVREVEGVPNALAFWSLAKAQGIWNSSNKDLDLGCACLAQLLEKQALHNPEAQLEGSLALLQGLGTFPSYSEGNYRNFIQRNPLLLYYMVLKQIYGNSSDQLENIFKILVAEAREREPALLAIHCYLLGKILNKLLLNKIQNSAKTLSEDALWVLHSLKKAGFGKEAEKGLFKAIEAGLFAKKDSVKEETKETIFGWISTILEERLKDLTNSQRHAILNNTYRRLIPAAAYQNQKLQAFNSELQSNSPDWLALLPELKEYLSVYPNKELIRLFLQRIIDIPLQMMDKTCCKYITGNFSVILNSLKERAKSFAKHSSDQKVPLALTDEEIERSVFNEDQRLLLNALLLSVESVQGYQERSASDLISIIEEVIQDYSIATKDKVEQIHRVLEKYFIRTNGQHGWTFAQIVQLLKFFEAKRAPAKGLQLMKQAFSTMPSNASASDIYLALTCVCDAISQTSIDYSAAGILINYITAHQLAENIPLASKMAAFIKKLMAEQKHEALNIAINTVIKFLAGNSTLVAQMILSRHLSPLKSSMETQIALGKMLVAIRKELPRSLHGTLLENSTHRFMHDLMIHDDVERAGILLQLMAAYIHDDRILDFFTTLLTHPNCANFVELLFKDPLILTSTLLKINNKDQTYPVIAALLANLRAQFAKSSPCINFLVKARRELVAKLPNNRSLCILLDCTIVQCLLDRNRPQDFLQADQHLNQLIAQLQMSSPQERVPYASRKDALPEIQPVLAETIKQFLRILPTLYDINIISMIDPDEMICYLPTDDLIEAIETILKQGNDAFYCLAASFLSFLTSECPVPSVLNRASQITDLFEITYEKLLTQDQYLIFNRDFNLFKLKLNLLRRQIAPPVAIERIVKKTKIYERGLVFAEEFESLEISGEIAEFDVKINRVCQFLREAGLDVNSSNVSIPYPILMLIKKCFSKIIALYSCNNDESLLYAYLMKVMSAYFGMDCDSSTFQFHVKLFRTEVLPSFESFLGCLENRFTAQAQQLEYEDFTAARSFVQQAPMDNLWTNLKEKGPRLLTSLLNCFLEMVVENEFKEPRLNLFQSFWIHTHFTYFLNTPTISCFSQDAILTLIFGKAFTQNYAVYEIHRKLLAYHAQDMMRINRHLYLIMHLYICENLSPLKHALDVDPAMCSGELSAIFRITIAALQRHNSLIPFTTTAKLLNEVKTNPSMLYDDLHSMPQTGAYINRKDYCSAQNAMQLSYELIRHRVDFDPKNFFELSQADAAHLNRNVTIDIVQLASMVLLDPTQHPNIQRENYTYFAENTFNVLQEYRNAIFAKFQKIQKENQSDPSIISAKEEVEYDIDNLNLRLITFLNYLNSSHRVNADIVNMSAKHSLDPNIAIINVTNLFERYYSFVTSCLLLQVELFANQFQTMEYNSNLIRTLMPLFQSATVEKGFSFRGNAAEIWVILLVQRKLYNFAHKCFKTLVAYGVFPNPIKRSKLESYINYQTRGVAHSTDKRNDTKREIFPKSWQRFP